MVEPLCADVGRGGGSLPYETDTFDKLYIINALCFWPDLLDALLEVRRVLKPSGMLVVALLPTLSGAGLAHTYLPLTVSCACVTYARSGRLLPR
jgi:SAM-dependent methyltransferase